MYADFSFFYHFSTGISMECHSTRIEQCANLAIMPVFDISEEIKKLSEIKDIQDELQMIADVAIQQTKAVLTLDDVLDDNSRSTVKSLENVQRFRRTINRYQKDARQAHDEVGCIGFYPTAQK
jgi:hypothetical protein